VKWIVLVANLIHLRVDEIDPYKKPKELLEISPKSMVPSIKLNNYSPPRGLNESMVILDFLEELVFYYCLMRVVADLKLS
jgi:glutathione S-transferase